MTRIGTITRRLAAATVLMFAAVAIGATVPASGHQGDDTAALERELAERHAPVFRLVPQPEPCSSTGEAFRPMSVDVVLDNDDVLLRQAGVADPVVTRGPAAEDLADRGEGFFLDFNGLALEPGCVYEHDFRRYTEDQPSVVYARVVGQPDSPDKLALQYWLYWYYNDWNNKHESDWEFIQLLFEASDAAEALATEPTSIGYAQHEGGEEARWNDDKLQREGTHPVVFPSSGSHASYFEEAYFLGRRGTEGFGCDSTLGASTRVVPKVVMLPTSVDDAPAGLDWISFEGRWGERHSGPFDGPTGPATKDRWHRPVEWHEGLRGSSVSIPGSDETDTQILRRFCSVVAFGSEQIRIAQTSPFQPIALTVGALGAVYLVARRTRWGSLPIVPLARRRRVGQMLRGAATAIWTTRGRLLLLGLVYLPAAAIVAAAGRFGSFSIAQATAGLLTSLLYVVVVVLVSANLHLAGNDRIRLREGSRLAWSRLWPAFKTGLLSTTIVAALTVTIIGLPWAIRQTVRYQFAIPVTTVEQRSGWAALRRSTELVEGRWWRTATTVGVMLLLGAGLNSALQLVLLIVFSGVPLWAYVSLSFLVTGLFLPAVAIAPVLVYGDAVAVEHESG